MTIRAMNDLDAEIAEMEKELNTPTEESIESTEVGIAPVQEPTVPTDTVIADLQRQLDTANKRYNNFKPSTDITIRDLRNELNSLRSQVTNLHTENSKLKSAATPTKDMASYFSLEDREILGETAVEALDKSVKDIVDAKVNPLQEQLKLEREDKQRMMAQERANAAQAAMNDFSTKLSAVVPEFQEIVGNDDFRLRWIKEIDPMSGYLRETLFTNAEKEGDVGRVASFFIDYKNATAVKHNALEEHMVPTGVTGNAPVVTQSSGEFQITEKFIDKFYDDLARGSNEYKGKKGRDLAMRTEAAIDQFISNQFS